MKIDASRYTSFWSNPERYRLRECWKLSPVEPKAGTFASLLTYGRRRGTCLHELLDARYRKVDQAQAVQELKDGGFGEREIEAAKRMAAAVLAKYPTEEYLAHEVLFEYPIPGSPHIATGRIDHILNWDGETIIGDWKSTKARTKKDMAAKAEQYKNSVQVPFYLLGASTLGFNTHRFLYRLVVDSDPVEIQPHWTERSTMELKVFAQSVHQTCETIEFFKRTFGTEKPWPQLPQPFSTGYESIQGRPMYEGFLPDGYEPKVEHLISMMEEPSA